MGTPKLLLPWGTAGRTVIETVLAAWRASRVERTVVVTHPLDSELAATCRAAGADVFVAPEPPPDMKASVRYGLEYLARTASPADRDAWLVAPADLPILSTVTIDRVIAAYSPTSARAVRPRHGEKFGHPVLWPWAAAGQIARLPENRGLDALLERTGFDPLECGAEGVGGDIDTPEEYRRLRDRYDRNDA
jgi:molybdenum cofactor cytidylyltransferase